ncbi:MAG TPA: YbgC/FadM family acyl-CoA thioesterase [Xanthomonadales bacterium]|nr:YbgC/FadM family acyl-CoA thioesterase [Xanthomonadales bacterium]
MTKRERQLFVWPVRVYFEDTDAGGVVYHARYLNFFERARTELLRSRGVECETLRQEHRLIWVVLDIQVKFLQAAKLDDELLVSAELAWIKGVRQGFRQQMNRKTDGVLVATAELSAALLHAESLKPARMPSWLQTELSDDK